MGGKLSESEAEDSESGGEEVAAAPDEVEGITAIVSKIPICFHQTPPIVLKELVWSLNVKHVLDLTPSPSTAAAVLIGEYGVSYCCIASTETAATWFRNKVHDDLMKMCGEEGTKLYAQCQLWSGMVHDNTQAMPAPGVPKKRQLGGGGTGGAAGGGQHDGESTTGGKKKPKRTPKTQNVAAGEDIVDGETQSGGGNGGGGGGPLDIGALLAAAKQKARGADKTTHADDDEARADE